LSQPCSVCGNESDHAFRTVAHGGLRRREGRIGWILLWLLGIPIPILVVLYVLRGCT